MYHLVPLCCICLKYQKTLKKLSENQEELLDYLSNNNNFETLKLELPLFICKKCSAQLSKIQQFQQQYNNNITKMFGYVSQLNNDEYYCEPKIIIKNETELNSDNNETNLHLECVENNNDNSTEKVDIIETINNKITTIIDESLTNDYCEPKRKKKDNNWYDSSNVLKSLLKDQPPSIYRKPTNQKPEAPSADFVNNMRENFKSILQKNEDQQSSSNLVDNIRNRFSQILQKTIEPTEIDIKTEEIEYMMIEPKEELFID